MPRKAASVSFLPGHIDSAYAHFCCHPRLLSGKPLSLLRCASIGKLDCLIWRKRIKLGDVAAIIVRLFAQDFRPCSNHAWPVTTKLPTMQRPALLHLPEGNLHGDPLSTVGICTCLNHVRYLVGNACNNHPDPSVQAVLAARNTLLSVRQGPLGRSTASVCVVYRADDRTLA